MCEPWQPSSGCCPRRMLPSLALDPDPDVRLVAVRHDDIPLDVLARLAADPNRQIRIEAFVALAGAFFETVDACFAAARWRLRRFAARIIPSLASGPPTSKTIVT